MNSLQVVKWKLLNCKQSINSYDKLLQIHNTPQKTISLLIKPIVGIRNHDKLEVIYGWNSIENFKDKNIPEIPVYILDSNISFFEIFQLILNYYKSDNELNPLQISNLLSYIISEITDTTELRKFTQILGISGKDTIIKKYISIQNINMEILLYLLKKKAPVKTWFLFTDIEKNDDWFFINFLSKMNPSLSIVNEVIMNLQESALREKVALSVIFQKIKTPKYFDADEPMKLLSSFRKDIFQIRYPEIFNHIQELEQHLQKIKTPNNIKLQFDKSFETKNIQSIINISSSQDLKNAANFFNNDNVEQIKSLIKKL